MYRDCELTLVHVRGPDATAFLGAQCTVDLSALPADRSRLAAIADHRGRVLLVFRAWRSEDGWRLAVPTGEGDWLCSHLARYRLRSRVSFDREHDAGLLGVTGSEAESALRRAGLPAGASGSVATRGDLQALALPHRRWLVVGGPEPLDDLVARLGDAAESDPAAWRRRRLLAREPELTTATRARFLPQALGLDALGAIDYGKGCYPGQEVITRVRMRGRIKRRLALLLLDQVPAPGERFEVAGQSLDLLDSAPRPQGGCLAQAVIEWPAAAELQGLIAPADASAE